MVSHDIFINNNPFQDLFLLDNNRILEGIVDVVAGEEIVVLLIGFHHSD